MLSAARAVHRKCARQPVKALAPDFRGGALAIVGPNSLRRRSPDGRWTELARSEFELSCCMAVGDAMYVGTEDARLLRFNPAGGVLVPLDGFDNVPGRNTWFAGSAILDGVRFGPPLGVRTVAANANGSILFANVHVGGIPRSLDRGNSWQPTIEIASDVHQVIAHPADPAIVVAAAAVGFCMSRDGGATWSVEREGLHAPHCSAVAISGDDVFISASADPFADQGRIYRRPLQPHGHLTAVEGGMPAWTEGIVDTGCVAVSGPIVVIMDRAANIYRSDDFGRHWVSERAGLPAPASVLIC